MNSNSEVILFLSFLIALGFWAQKYSKLISYRFGIKGEALIGIEFVLIGLLLGPHGINLLPPETLQDLFPIFSLALGWIGLTMMIEMDFRTVKRIPYKLAGLSAWASFITFAFVFFLFKILSSTGQFSQLKLSWPLILATLALPVAPAMMSSQARNLKVRWKKFAEMLTLSVLDDFYSVLFYLFLFPYFINNLIRQSYFKIFLSCIGVGVISGVFLNLFTLTSRKRAEILLILLGTVFLASGLSLMLNVSPLLASAVSGVVVANSSYKKMRMADVLQKAERPIFFFLLVIVGALLDFNAIQQQKMIVAILLVAAVFVILRAAGKYMGYWTGTKFYGPLKEKIGLTLIGQSGIYVALLVDLRLALKGPESNELLFAGILAFVLNAIAVHFIVRLRAWI